MSTQNLAVAGNDTKTTLITKIVAQWEIQCPVEVTKKDLAMIKAGLKGLSNNQLKNILRGRVSRNLPLDLLLFEIMLGQKKPSAPAGRPKLPPGLAYASIINVDSDQEYLDETTDEGYLSDEPQHDGSEVVTIQDEELFNKWQLDQAKKEAKRISKLHMFKLAKKFTGSIPTMEYYSRRFGGCHGEAGAKTETMGFEFKWGLVKPPLREEFPSCRFGDIEYKAAMTEYWTHEDSDMILPHVRSIHFDSSNERIETTHYLSEGKAEGCPIDLRKVREHNIDGIKTVVDPVQNAKDRRNGTFTDWSIKTNVEVKPVKWIYPQDMVLTTSYKVAVDTKGRKVAKDYKTVDGLDANHPTYISPKGIILEKPVVEQTHGIIKIIETEAEIKAYILANPVSTVHHQEPEGRRFHSDIRLDEKAYAGFDRGHLIPYAGLDVADRQTANDFNSEDPSELLEKLEQDKGYNIYLGGKK